MPGRPLHAALGRLDHSASASYCAALTLRRCGSRQLPKLNELLCTDQQGHRVYSQLMHCHEGNNANQVAWSQPPHSATSVRSYLSGCRLWRLPPLVARLLPQSSSPSRLAAGAEGFLTLSQ